MATNHIPINTGSLYADRLRTAVNALRHAQKLLAVEKANMDQMIDTGTDYTQIAELYLGNAVPASADGQTAYNLLSGAEAQLRTQTDIVQFTDRFGGVA